MGACSTIDPRSADIFRHAVSPDFVNVFRLDGTSFGEISLNEGATWPNGSFHMRDIFPDRPTMLGEIRRVLIRHQAAGDDINADNWTAALIVVTAVLTDGTERELTRAEGVRFRKNDHQTWEQVFI